MDEKYSKRQIILESNDILIDETDFDDSFIDELEDITSLIQSNSSYSNDFISDRTQDENLDNEILTEDIVKDIDKEEQGSVETIDGDSLDGVAYKFYGNCALRWAILDANPKYRTEWDIENGDVINIPDYEEVVELVNGEI